MDINSKLRQAGVVAEGMEFLGMCISRHQQPSGILRPHQRHLMQRETRAQNNGPTGSIAKAGSGCG